MMWKQYHTCDARIPKAVPHWYKTPIPPRRYIGAISVKYMGPSPMHTPAYFHVN